MSYIVPAGASLPPAPTVAHSGDGVLTATLDGAHSGVQLFADFSPRTEQILDTNFYPDPSHEYGISPFATSASVTVTTDTSRKHSGAQSLALTVVSAGTYYKGWVAATHASDLGLAVGDSVTFSAWVYIPTGTTINASAITIFGAGIGTVYSAPSQTTARDQWVQATATTTVTDATGNINVRIYSGSVVGNKVNYDDLGIAKGSAPVDFNGGTAGTADVSYRWMGLYGSSRSQKFIPARTFTSESVAAVRVYREGAGTIASGSPAPAVAGQALAYDHFMPLGQNSSWYAEAVNEDGVVLYTSETVPMFVPAQPLTTELWVKSTTDPGLSIKLKAVSDIPEVTYTARQNFSQVIGNPFTVGSFDVWDAPNTEWTILVESVEQRTQLVNCLQSGVLFIQPHPSLDVDSFYGLAGDITRTYGGNATQVDQLVQVSFTNVAAPAVEGTPLLTPGKTWQTIETYYADWTAVESSFDNWRDVAGLPITE